MKPLRGWYVYCLVYQHYRQVNGCCYDDKMEDHPKLTEATARVLTRLREEAGLSKRKLATLTSIDRVYLLQLEQRKYRPTLNAVFLLAQALGLPPGRLVDMIEAERLRLLDEATDADVQDFRDARESRSQRDGPANQ